MIFNPKLQILINSLNILPAGGYWSGTTNYRFGSLGRYWTRTYYDSTDTNILNFDGANIESNSYWQPGGLLIRSVHPKHW